MAITSVGYDGSVGESVWGGLAARFGSPEPGVAGDSDLDVTLAGGDAVKVAAGTAYGWGVSDTTGGESVTLTRPPSGARHDLIVLRRDWTTNTTALFVVQGGTERVLPETLNQPGVRADQPLALVQVPSEGSLVISDDLRVTHGTAAVIRAEQALQSLPVGSRAVDGAGRRWQRTAAGVAPDWEPPAPPPPQVPIVAAGTATITTNQYGSATIQHGLGWKPDVVHVAPRMTTDSGLVECFVSSSSTALTATTVNITCKKRTATGQVPYEGALTYVDWIATKRGTTSAVTVPTPDGSVVVTPGPAVPDGSDPADPTDPPPSTTGPVTSGGGTDTVPRDTGAAPAPQIPIPDTPPEYKVTTPTSTSVAGILATAAAEIGTRESPSGSNRVKYWLAEKPSLNGQPWCACFSAWVYRRNGISVNTVLTGITDNNPYYTPYLEAAARRLGLWYEGTPRPADMVIYGNSKKPYGTVIGTDSKGNKIIAKAVHVAIVEKWVASTGRVQEIGGNTSDGLNGSPNNGGGVFRNLRNPSSASFPIRGYIRMPTAVPTDLRVKGPWPLPTGHYFGVADASSTLDHNGSVAADRTAIMQIQAEVGAAIDGQFGPQTETAVKTWQKAMFRTQTGQITEGDWQVLLGTFTAPPRPTGIVASAGVGTATVVFNASSGAQQYTAIEVNTGATKTGTASPITFTGLPAGRPVKFQVVATNVGGASARSAISNTVWPTEGALATVPADDGSVFMVWAGSSKTPEMVGSVRASNLDATTYNGFCKALPAAKHTAAIQQAARNVAAVLYDGSTWRWPATRSQVTLEFTAQNKLADATSETGVISIGRDAPSTRNVASWLTHEVVHLFQSQAPNYGVDKYVTGLTEGIADYALMVLGYHTPIPPTAGATWYGGYDTTASFLWWIEREAPVTTPNFVRRLNAQFKAGWTPAQITSINARGMTVDALWAEYVKAKA